MIYKNIEEDNYLSDWYDWEDIYNEKDNFYEEIDPEEIVAINKGFGLTKGMSTLVGSLRWDNGKKRFIFSNIKIEMSRRLNFYDSKERDKRSKTGLFKLTDLSSPTLQYHKVLMKLGETQKVYSSIEKQKIFKLDDTNKPIYSFNEVAKLNLTSKELVENYILFFFLNVKGRHGRFYPITTKTNTLQHEINNFLHFSMERDELHDFYSKVANKSFSHESETKIAELDFNMKFSNEGNTDSKVDEFFILFKDSIFSAGAHIEENGNVSLTDEKLLFEGLTEQTAED